MLRTEAAPVLGPEDTERIVKSLLPGEVAEEFRREKDANFSQVMGGSSIRVTLVEGKVYRVDLGAGRLRYAREKVPKELLPDRPVNEQTGPRNAPLPSIEIMKLTKESNQYE